LKPDESTFGASFPWFYPRTKEREPLTRIGQEKSKDGTCQPPSRRADGRPGIGSSEQSEGDLQAIPSALYEAKIKRG
jgi:hypothetical protein